MRTLLLLSLYVIIIIIIIITITIIVMVVFVIRHNALNVHFYNGLTVKSVYLLVLDEQLLDLTYCYASLSQMLATRIGTFHSSINYIVALL